MLHFQTDNVSPITPAVFPSAKSNQETQYKLAYTFYPISVSREINQQSLQQGLEPRTSPPSLLPDECSLTRVRFPFAPYSGLMNIEFFIIQWEHLNKTGS